ncbi:MAG: ATP-dependent zinc protease [Legionellales bacterium]|jgi:hypothetical protein
MRKIHFYLTALLVLWTSLSFAHAANIMGWVEKGKLVDQNLELEIKMDTGALTASLGAHDIKLFEKDGQEWVSFTINGALLPQGERFEYPLKRMARIKKRSSEMKSDADLFERRPVIEMDLCLGDEARLIEVNLNDRSYFNYQMLLGRTALAQFDILIDSSESHTHKPMCEVKPTENPIS